MSERSASREGSCDLPEDVVKIKVGLIPPRGLENLVLRSKFHLSLAIDELMNRRMYSGMYKRAAELGDYVVLDNGLAEGMPCTPSFLYKHAKEIGASEVVVPDVMQDAEGTINQVKLFFEDRKLLPIKHMAVAQGKTLPEFRRCVEEFAKVEFITVVGIPRHMLETLRTQPCRIEFANWVADKFPGRFELHFLGTNPVWIGEVKAAAKYTPARSVDTSMPFSYAMAGEDLALSAQQIIRPKRYFETDWSRFVDVHLVRHNISTLLEWAGATGTRSHAAAETSARPVRRMSAVQS